MQNPLSKILPAYRLRQVHPFKARFKELGISQADLGELLHCSGPEVSRWLNNSRSMPRSVERELTEILQRLEQGGFVPRRIEPLPPVDFKSRFQALGFSQAKLARAISRSESEISKWLNNKRPIPREAHLAMLEILQQMGGEQ